MGFRKTADIPRILEIFTKERAALMERIASSTVLPCNIPARGPVFEAELASRRKSRVKDSKLFESPNERLVNLLCLDLGVCTREFFSYKETMELREKFRSILVEYAAAGHAPRRQRLKGNTCAP